VTGGDEDGDHQHAVDGEQVLGHVLDAGHELPPEDVPRLVATAAVRLGASDAQLYLASVAQRLLVPMPLRRGEDVEPLDIDTTLAGRAFQSSAPTGTDGDGDMWIPVRDGVDRLGVLRLRFASYDEVTLRAARQLASLAAALVVAKSRYSDLFEQVRRREPLVLAAELQRQLLPPSTFSTPRVGVAGVLEPAYEVAGDSFDYALNADVLSAAVFDGVGHDLASAVMTTLAVGAYRNARRNRLDLAETATVIDQALRSQFADKSFVTAALIQLDVSTGAVRWLNAGHPRPLLLRSGRVVRTLGCPPRAPLGVPCAPAEIAAEQLEPGDALLLFTDGVVEARSSSGQAFGFDRLADFFERAAAAGLESAETLRRLVHDVVDHHGGVLRDDATCVLIDWHGRRAGID
jgi:serine phosphatase RsbU (regulator of sigma subunit)